MMSRKVLAEYMGYLSIAFWLCAQLPQVFKNASLQSCEGLALPFLMNWLFGDITNLIGCLLTDQLPFQKYLAAYFCVIDFTLLVQYFHYRPVKPAHHHIHHHSHTHPHTAYSTFSPTTNSAASLHASLILPHRTSSRPGNSRARSVSNTAIQPLMSTSPRLPRQTHGTIEELPTISDSAVSHDSAATARPRFQRDSGAQGSSSTLMESPLLTGHHTDGSYAALYEAALDVARVAERVTTRNVRRSQSRRRRISRQVTNEDLAHATDEGEGEGMMDSFHSDMSKWTAGSSTASNEENGNWASMTMSTPGPQFRDGDGGRGRSLQRRTDNGPATSSHTPSESGDQPTPLARNHDHGHDGDKGDAHRSKSRSLSLARESSGRGGRRAAGVAFMSIGLVLRGWYASTNGGLHAWAPADSGIVPSGRIIGSYTPSSSVAVEYRHPPIHPVSPRAFESHNLYFTIVEKHKPHQSPDDPPAYEYDRVIGRISAWCCTTLYLTSRLPQIWKNFKRRSVEGLSILLFLFAFCGNLFYVLSILLNPSGQADPVDAGHYLLESLPYLLGSGGTLVFDLTIMFQSTIYGSAPPQGNIDNHKRLRLPNKRKHASARFAEEGFSPIPSFERVDRVDRADRTGERAPLILPPPAQGRRTWGKGKKSRDRSWSPDVSTRRLPAPSQPEQDTSE